MCLLCTEEVPVNHIKPDVLLNVLAVFIMALFVFLCCTKVPLILHSLSAGNNTTNMFCQLNMEHRDCLCDLKVVVMNI